MLTQNIDLWIAQELRKHKSVMDFQFIEEGVGLKSVPNGTIYYIAYNRLNKEYHKIHDSDILRSFRDKMETVRTEIVERHEVVTYEYK